MYFYIYVFLFCSLFTWVEGCRNFFWQGVGPFLNFADDENNFWRNMVLFEAAWPSFPQGSILVDGLMAVEVMIICILCI